jgi:hypothetical protein
VLRNADRAYLQAPFRSGGVSIESCSILLVCAIKMASLLIAG